MTLVESYVGYLLSKYKETIEEGLQKIHQDANNDSAFAVRFLSDRQALEALRQLLLKRRDLDLNIVETLCALLEGCEVAMSSPSPSVMTLGSPAAVRSSALRELLQDNTMFVFKNALSSTKDSDLPMTVAVLHLLRLAAEYIPKVLLARFQNRVPLHLACFRPSLPYAQRRLRLYRSQFLLRLATSRLIDTAQVIMTSHGLLTHLVEDAAELLVEGSVQGETLGRDVLRLLHSFIQHRGVSAAEKRVLLLSQRNVLRLLVKAIDYTPVVEEVMQTLSLMVKVLLESPSDYARHRLDTLTAPNAAGGEDRGMPNYLLFLLLRQLRPRKGPKVVELIMHILYLAPDLIRPYFSRFSQHLVDDVHHQSRQGRRKGENGITLPTAKIALINLMTRIFLAPLPYHLSQHLASLHFSRVPSQGHLVSWSSFVSEGKGDALADAGEGMLLPSTMERPEMFYQMTPKDVVQEICPVWIGEFIHQIINGSTDLLFLVLAMQLTQSALYRAAAVLEAVREISSRMIRSTHTFSSEISDTSHTGNSTGTTLPDAQHPIFHEGYAQESWEAFEAEVESELLAALPKREEFLHRLTQQLHPILMAGHPTTSISTPEQREESKEGKGIQMRSLPRIEFIIQRMLLLFHSYTTLFRLRVSWISVLPHQLPLVFPKKRLGLSHQRGASVEDGKKSPFSSALIKEKESNSYITSLLESDVDFMLQWSPSTISVLCSLLSESMARGVSINKLHHINLSSSSEAVGTNGPEWPLLLRLMAWACLHRDLVLDCGKEEKHVTHTDSPASSLTQSEYRHSVCLAISWVARVVQWAVHGVTVSVTCTYGEVFLWLQVLSMEVLPCFLHTLNHLLQRSLSKAADRVRAELLGSEYGVLVVAAEHFIASQKEKEGRSLQSSVRGSSNASMSADPWVEDLHLHLPMFEKTVYKVRKRWINRREISNYYISSLQTIPRYAPHITRLGTSHTRKAVACSGSSFLTSPVRPSALDQWMGFRSALETPLLPATTEESELRERLWNSSTSLLPNPAKVNSIVTKSTTVRIPGREVKMEYNKINELEESFHHNMSLLDQALHVFQLSFSASASTSKPQEGSPRSAAILSTSVKSAALWYQMSAVCWDVVRHVLLTYLAFTSTSSFCLDGPSFPIALRNWLHRFLQHVVNEEKAIIHSFSEGKDDAVIGFDFLLLTCLHLLLVERRETREEKKQWNKSNLRPETENVNHNESVQGWINYEGKETSKNKIIEEVSGMKIVVPVLKRIESIFCQQYHGTVGIVDRICYAALLTIHYLVQATEENANGEAEENESNEKSKKVGSEASEVEEGQRRVRSVQESCSFKSFAQRRPPYVCTGATLPQAFHSNRFVIWNHVSPPNITPEVDMLQYLTSMWTSQELVMMALEMPARLHNTLLCGSCISTSSPGRVSSVFLPTSRPISSLDGQGVISSLASASKRPREQEKATKLVTNRQRPLFQPDPLYDLTRAIFPEVTVETDLTEVLLFNTASCSSTILDPRYLLPLLQTVFSLPKNALSLAQRLYVGSRCFPYLLRSLSFTDPSLRLCAMAGLSTMVIPAGPLKVIDTFTRLKLIQRAQKERNKLERVTQLTARSEEQGSFGKVTANVSPPRLSAPLSAFLVLSIRAMGRYDDPLHHHLSHFFLDTHESFAVAVPFAHWLISFPLDAISHPLMVRQQEKALLLQHASGTTKSTSTSSGGGSIFGSRALEDGHNLGVLNGGASSSSGGSSHDTSLATISHFQKTTPPHLRFILRLVSFGCQTKGDAVALVESGCLQGIMLLCSMLTSSNELRHELIQCITQICFSQTSSAVGVYLAQEGHLLPWIFQFLLQLCREYGVAVPHLYVEPLFCSSMALATRLSRIVFEHGDRLVVRKLIHPFLRNHLQLLRQYLAEARVTAKQTLELMMSLECLWNEEEIPLQKRKF